MTDPIPVTNDDIGSGPFIQPPTGPKAMQQSIGPRTMQQLQSRGPGGRGAKRLGDYITGGDSGNNPGYASSKRIRRSSDTYRPNMDAEEESRDNAWRTFARGSL
jgi:hypothetical protein